MNPAVAAYTPARQPAAARRSALQAPAPLRRTRGAVLLGIRALAAWLALAAAATAWALDPPKGKVLLSVTGKVTQRNAAGRADFDMAMLDALPKHSFSTGTPWFKGPRRFSGPLLRDVLAVAGAQGSTLVAVALNDYRVEIPADDAQRFKVLLATRLDGQPMPVREKGPLFIIYPYDDSADLRSERYYSRSAWQLRRLDVR